MVEQPTDPDDRFPTARAVRSLLRQLWESLELLPDQQAVFDRANLLIDTHFTAFETLHRISSQFSTAHDVQEAVETLRIYPRLQGVLRIAVVLFDRAWADAPPQGAKLSAVSATIDSPEHSPGAVYTLQDYKVTDYLSPEQAVLITHVAKDDRLGFAERQILNKLGTQSLLLLPLRAHNQWIGMLDLHSKAPGYWNEEDTYYLQVMANQTAIVLYHLHRDRYDAAGGEDGRALLEVARDLRTPLTTIQSYAASLLAEDLDWDALSQREFVRIISEEADLVTDMLDSILLYLDLQSGGLQLLPTRVSVVNLLSKSLPALQDAAPERDLQVAVDHTLPQISIDTERIEYVLKSLVDNATKFGPQDTPIEIRARPLDGGASVEICVRDHGDELPEGDYERIFQPFVRLPGSSFTPGSGLGLTISKQIVEAHDGSLYYDPPHGESRSGFCFTLPVSS